MVVHDADAGVAGCAADADMRRDRYIQLAGDLERGALGKLGIVRHVERQHESEHVAATLHAAGDELAKRRLRCPLPWRLLDVAVAQDESPGHRFQRVHRRLAVLDRLQAV